jgi:hypothetical protein
LNLNVPPNFSFSVKAPSLERTGMNFKIFLSVNIHIVALFCSDREHDGFVLS